jgi:hypothetical protein
MVRTTRIDLIELPGALADAFRYSQISGPSRFKCKPGAIPKVPQELRQRQPLQILRLSLQSVVYFLPDKKAPMEPHLFHLPLPLLLFPSNSTPTRPWKTDRGGLFGLGKNVKSDFTRLAVGSEQAPGSSDGGRDLRNLFLTRC